MTRKRVEIPLFVLSISHKQAPVEIRRLFSFHEKEIRKFLSRVKEEKDIWGAVLVSTCNRTEVYFSGESRAVVTIQRLLADAKEADLHLLRKFFRIYQGEKASRHLFRVTSGLDSMVLGEDEILGQIRLAYNAACREGVTDYYINSLFQRALGCAKQIKTDTCLSKSSVSVATLSAACAVHFKEGVKRVLLLGATGQMGSLIAKNLAGRKDVELFAAVRRHCGIQLPDGAVEIAYGERYFYLDQADVVISATSSPHYTITYEACRASMETEKPRLFLDIAVPNDIDPDVILLKGAELRNIDFFQKIASDHNSQKEEGRRQAESVIEEKCREAEKDLAFHKFLPILEEFKECVRERNALQLFYCLRDYADTRELQVILEVCRRFMEDQKH